MEKLRERKGRKTSSLDSDHHSSPPLLPFDLMMDIFSRLSLKSISVCRCVSKQWASVLSHPDFRDLRLTRSQARPRLLFACIQDNNVFFLSTPLPQGPDDEMSSSSDHHISFSFDHHVEDVSKSFSGFVCVRIRRKFMVDESVVCNPSTGQSLAIPKMKTRKRTGMIRFFGYDPVEKLHKVLGMNPHQVLTLGGGTEKATWRMAERGISYTSSPFRQHLCINGVIYYIELASNGRVDSLMICFDVRSEKFSLVKFPEPVHLINPDLLDCNGKLALLVSESLNVSSENIVMWVLQDLERHEWSKLVYILPSMWKAVVDPGERLEIVGLTGPNELVVSPRYYSSHPFHVYYCNFEKETVTRVVIKGMEAFENGRTYSVHTYLNHVEDLKRMEL